MLPGQRVMVLNKRSRTRGKLENKWERLIYVVVSQPNIDIPVCVVRLEGVNGQERVLHRNMLSPCKFNVVPTQQEEVGVACEETDVNKNSNSCMYPWVWGCPTGPVSPQPTEENVSDCHGSPPSAAQLPDATLASPMDLDPLPMATEGLRRSTRATKGRLPQRYQM